MKSSGSAVCLSLLFIFIPQALSRTSHGSAGCSLELPPQVTPGGPSHAFSLRSTAGGGERSYLISVPSTYSNANPSPLILAFHGKGQNSSTFSTECLFHDPDFNALDAIVAYPQGLDDQWTGDPAAPPPSSVNDMLFTADLLNHLESNFCVDFHRLYAAGFSNGGGLTGLLACHPELSSRFAAFAVASGAFYEDSALHGEPLFSLCSPSRSEIPMLEFHGLADPVEHYDGVGTPDGPNIPIAKWVGDWATRNGCGQSAKNITKMLFNGTEKHSFSCSGHEDVVIHYAVPGFGHGWPSTMALDNDYQRFGPTWFNATKIMVDFFRRWELPILPGAGAVGRDEL